MNVSIKQKEILDQHISSTQLSHLRLKFLSLELTREWSQLSASDLAETHTTYKELQFIMNPVEIFCKWPPAKRPEATKVAKIIFEKFKKKYFCIFEIAIL